MTEDGGIKSYSRPKPTKGCSAVRRRRRRRIFNLGTVSDHDEQNLISGNTRTVLVKILFTTSSRIAILSLQAPLPKN